MKSAARIVAATAWRRDLRGPVVFVPTMGALHSGHAALIRKARRIAGDGGKVAVSVFVNPTQFGVGEDFSRYPRTLAADTALCRKEGADLLFAPSAGEMYSADASIMISERSLSKGFCGASRPGHFDGVCTVVAMLLNILRADAALFGEKDWQQVAVIRRMVRDLKIPVRIVTHPTVREKDGLALSSRNRLLTPEARRLAPRIFQALTAAAMEAESGETSVARLEKGLRRDLTGIPGAVLDYASIVDEGTLLAIKRLGKPHRARVLAAVRFGSVRLIDNLPIPSPR